MGLHNRGVAARPQAVEIVPFNSSLKPSLCLASRDCTCGCIAIVMTAKRFEAEVCLIGDRWRIDAKSFLAVFRLSATKGAQLFVAAQEPDAEHAAPVIDFLKKPSHQCPTHHRDTEALRQGSLCFCGIMRIDEVS